MIKKIFAYFSLTLCCIGEIYNLEDVQLDLPISKNLKEEVIYSFIFNVNSESIHKKLKDLKNKNIIDALDFYQYTNLLKREVNFQEYYFVDSDLLILKKLSLAEKDNKTFSSIIKERLNDKYVYDYFIYRAFNFYQDFMDPFILNLKSSQRQFKLFIKYNYEKGNFVYLKSMMRKLKGKDKLLILDLIIEGNTKINNEDKIKLIEQRNDMSYEKIYSHKLIELYEAEKLYFAMLAEINSVLEQEKNFKLVKKIIEQKAKNLNEDDYQNLKSKVEDEKVAELRYLIIEELYKQGKNYDSLLPEQEKEATFSAIYAYYKIIDYIKKNEPRAAKLLLSNIPIENQNEGRFRKLKGQLNILLNEMNKDEKSHYFKLSKKLDNQQLFENMVLQKSEFMVEFNSQKFELKDFYNAYENIDKNPQELFKCIRIYESIKKNLTDKQQRQLQLKMEALGFE